MCNMCTDMNNLAFGNSMSLQETSLLVTKVLSNQENAK